MHEKKLMNVKDRVRNITRQLIRDLRDREHLTQTELAQKIGINRSLISQYESGDRDPSLLSLVKLADYAHVSVDYLLGRDVSPKYELTRAEEQFVEVYRKVPVGHEVIVTKEEGADKGLKENQIKVKQDVKI